MGIWTVATVEILNRIRHVRLVVGAIQIDAIPARREEYLCPHRIRALVRKEVTPLLCDDIVRIIVSEAMSGELLTPIRVSRVIMVIICTPV